MAVDRHLRRVASAGDGIDAGRPDAIVVEQLAGRREQAFAGVASFWLSLCFLFMGA
ncbi:hypothetical protein WJ967_07420 [Achromobacter xylosoxidans]